MKYIRFFDSVGMDDLPLVGGKNASLGEMISHLSQEGVRLPFGFAITADAYRYYVEANNCIDDIRAVMKQCTDIHDIDAAKKTSDAVQKIILSGTIPTDLQKEIADAYHDLSRRYFSQCDVAVRSSATAEDLPKASFAGQQESYLNVRGEKNLFDAYKKCLASLFTQRAIIYRVEKGFDHFKVALSVGVQKMVLLFLWIQKVVLRMLLLLNLRMGWEKLLLKD
jgi:pyruvate,water dikinase